MARFQVRFVDAAAETEGVIVDADTYATEAGFVTFYKTRVGPVQSFKSDTVLSVLREETSRGDGAA